MPMPRGGNGVCCGSLENVWVQVDHEGTRLVRSIDDVDDALTEAYPLIHPSSQPASQPASLDDPYLRCMHAYSKWQAFRCSHR